MGELIAGAGTWQTLVRLAQPGYPITPSGVVARGGDTVPDRCRQQVQPHGHVRSVGGCSG
jgi:hypothetical protein